MTSPNADYVRAVETADRLELLARDADRVFHPLLWDELRPYEKEQGGYWLYLPDTDVYGNGKVWVAVSPNGRSEP